MGTLATMINQGRRVVAEGPAWYKYWGGYEIEACAGGYMDCPSAFNNPAYVISNGVYCSGFINWMRVEAGLPPIGGTYAYGFFISPWSYFDPNQKYPVGTILLEPYIDGVSEGHVAMVWDYDHQLILQSNTYWGTADHVSVLGQHQFTPWAWAGYMPDALPGGVVETSDPLMYPGDCASTKAVAYWMANYAKSKGLPPILPIMTSYPEMAAAWDSEGCVTDIPGFYNAVDHDSYGYWQQRIMYFSEPWNSQVAIESFCDRALEEQYAWGYSSSETDPGVLGEWCANIQRPAEAYRFRYTAMGYPRATELLQGWSPEPAPDPVPDPDQGDMVFATYTLAAAGQPYIDYANAAVVALEAASIDAIAVNSAENIARASKQAKRGELDVLVVGNHAHNLLDDPSQDRWTEESPIWPLWRDEITVPGYQVTPGYQETQALHRLRNWALGWIAEHTSGASVDDLLTQFDDTLLSIDHAQYREVLEEAKKKETPDPRPKTLEDMVKDHERRITALEGGK